MDTLTTPKISKIEIVKSNCWISLNNRLAYDVYHKEDVVSIGRQGSRVILFYQCLGKVETKYYDASDVMSRIDDLIKWSGRR